MAARSSETTIVGAGIVGCAVAYELARRGAAVRLVDERAVGMGATQASAGILAPFIEAREDSAFLDLTVRSLGLFDEFLRSVTSDSGLAVPYLRTGTLDVALQEDGVRTLRATAGVLARRGVAAELIDGETARREEPHVAAAALAALVIPAHGFVGAGALTRALAVVARNRGAIVNEGVIVLRIVPNGDDLAIETADGTHVSRTVVLAAGSWSGRIEFGGVMPSVPVRPVRGQLLHLAWTGAPLRRVTWGERCYLVPWPDGTVLVGATVEDAGFDERATVAGVRDLLDAACELTPHARTSGFLGARVGLRPATPDDVPIIGRSSALPNLMFATGHYRNGVLLAPLTAKLVADALIDERIDPALGALSPARFGL